MKKVIFLLFVTIGVLSVLSLTADHSSPLVDYTSLADLQSYAHLPVGKVSSYEHPDAWGTAILIPQTHRYPGTDAADQANDSAEIAQAQIYETLSYLHEQFRVDFMMAEGDLYGEVPEGKISKLTEKISLRDRFSAQIETLKHEFQKESIDPAAERDFFKHADQFVASLDREIILEGAPYRLKAEREDITLFGSENKATREEGAVVVRDYIYLKDRLGELTSVPDQRNRGFTKRSGRTHELSEVYALLLSQNRNPGQSLESDLASLESLASFRGEDDLGILLAECKDTYQTIQRLRKQEEEETVSVPLPSREDNPYQSIRSPQEIQALLAETEQKIEEIVVVKRNQEVAENFARALKAEDTTIGILQFGAGHESGLIQELNEQGLSVIVITPKEVLQRSESS